MWVKLKHWSPQLPRFEKIDSRDRSDVLRNPAGCHPSFIQDPPFCAMKCALAREVVDILPQAWLVSKMQLPKVEALMVLLRVCAFGIEQKLRATQSSHKRDRKQKATYKEVLADDHSQFRLMLSPILLCRWKTISGL